MRVTPASPARVLLLLVWAILSAAANAAGLYDRGTLWRIDLPGVATSYLFGTMHSDDDRVLKLAPSAQRAFDRSKSFALELIADEPAITRFRAAMVTREPQLAETVGSETYAAVDKLLAERGISAQARARFKPWSALLVLIQPPESPGIILDQYLMLEAQRLHKHVVPLESIDEQIDAFAGLPLPDQLALLRYALSRQEEIRQAVRPLTEAYLEGDLARIWQLNQDTMGDDAAVSASNETLLQRVLYDRNRRFADRLEPLLRKGGLFAAFGALHLYGDQGVPALLAARGFRVRQVR